MVVRGKSRKTKKLREFILNHVTEHPNGIGVFTAQTFGVSRQAISTHLKELVEEGLLTVSGNTRNRKYQLREYVVKNMSFPVTDDIEEHVIWNESVRPLLVDLKENVLDICHYGFTEMANNVFSHSGAEDLMVSIRRTAVETTLFVIDEGIGIFRKIQNDFNLQDPRHSLLELSKGKLTSDASSHSGEGIFFTSMMFDRFNIWSENLFFGKTFQGGQWLIETDGEKEFSKGTMIIMHILENNERLIKEVFDEYASEHADWGFTKTHVVLELLRYEGEKLLSRSQAKRLLTRVDQFKEVVFDFNDISYIGQAFADEIFRVFRNEHPEVVISTVNTTEDIEKMITRVSA